MASTEDKVPTEHAVPETTHPSTSNKSPDSSINDNVLQEKQPIKNPAASNKGTEKHNVDTPAVVTEKGTSSSHHEVEDDEGAHYVHGAARIALVFGLCITTFLVGLDNLIIATAIPKITTLFHSLEDVGWYG
jgi:hypothetical protein